MSITAVCGANVIGWRLGRAKSAVRVVELLCSGAAVKPVVKLIGITVGAPGPVEGERRENSGHGMIGMTGDSAFGAECQHHLRAKAPHVQRSS